MHEVLVNRLGGLSLPRKSVVRLTDRPDMTLDVYRGRKTTIQQQQQPNEMVAKQELKKVASLSSILIATLKCQDTHSCFSAIACNGSNFRA